MTIKILGPGCPKCKKMAELATRAVKELGIQAQVEEVHDIAEIARHTYITPTMVVDEKVVMEGLKPYPTILETLKKLAG
ncbi:MAG: thioredoxin family protein [candidate division WOR-3 bacterium]